MLERDDLEQVAGQFAMSLPISDPQLQTLRKTTNFHEFSVGVALTVISSGCLISGHLATSREYALYLDEKLREWADRAIDGVAESADGMAESAELQVWRDEMENLFTTLIDLEQKGGEELREKLEAIAKEKGVSVAELESADLPHDVAIADIQERANPVHLTLREARLHAPYFDHAVQLDFIRVHIGQVSAWFPGEISVS